jgi:hypothetical protein
MKKPYKKIFGTVISASLLFILIGCSQQTESSKKNEDLEAVEVVLQNALTGPTDELKELLESKGVEGLTEYEEKLYKEHFDNDSSYMEFVNSYGSTLMIEPLRNGYQLKVKDINFEKTDSNENIFNFTVELEYQKEGSELPETGMVEGQADLNEEYKIENIMVNKNLWETFNE